jgi:hypothetical protein
MAASCCECRSGGAAHPSAPLLRSAPAALLQKQCPAAQRGNRLIFTACDLYTILRPETAGISLVFVQGATCEPPCTLSPAFHFPLRPFFPSSPPSSTLDTLETPEHTAATPACPALLLVRGTMGRGPTG